MSLRLASILGVQVAVIASLAYLFYRNLKKKSKESPKIKEEVNEDEFSIKSTKLWESHMRTATNLFKKESFEEALDFFTKAIEIFNENDKEKDSLALLFYNRSSTYLRLGKLKEAKNDTDKAINLNEDYARAYLKRASINEKLLLTEDCLSDLVTCCILEDHSVVNNNKYRDRIIREYSKNKIKDSPRQFLSYALHFSIKHFLDSYDEIDIFHSFFCQLLKLYNSTDNKSIINTEEPASEQDILKKLLSSIINWKSYKFTSAIDDLDKILNVLESLEFDSDKKLLINFICLLYKARLYTSLGQYDLSDTLFQSAHDLVDVSPWINHFKAVYFFEKAKDELNRIEDFDGISGPISNNDHLTKKLDSLINLLDNSLELFDFPFGQLEKAHILSRKIILSEQINYNSTNQPDLNILFKDIIDTLQRKNNKVSCCFFLSQIYSQLGNQEQAKISIEKAKLIDPTDLDVQIQSTFLNFGGSDITELFDEIEKIINLNPCSYVAYELLYILLSSLLHQKFDIDLAEKLCNGLKNMADLANTEMQREVIFYQMIGLKFSINSYKNLKRASPRYVPIPIFWK